MRSPHDALPRQGPAFRCFEGIIDGMWQGATPARLPSPVAACRGLLPAGAGCLIGREPLMRWAPPRAQALRQLLLQSSLSASGRPCPTAELVLYAAHRPGPARAGTDRPALAAGDWVLCDRFTGSTGGLPALRPLPQAG